MSARYCERREGKKCNPQKRCDLFNSIPKIVMGRPFGNKRTQLMKKKTKQTKIEKLRTI